MGLRRLAWVVVVSRLCSVDAEVRRGSHAGLLLPGSGKKICESASSPIGMRRYVPLVVPYTIPSTVR